MKILMIAPEPFLEPRGTPISIYERLIGLSALGYAVDLVTYHLGQDVEIQSVRIHRAPAIPFIREIRIGPSPAKVLLDLVLFFKTVQMLFSNKYDVVHTHEEASYFAVLLCKLFNLPHLYDMHSSLPKQLKISKFRKMKPVVWLFSRLEELVLKHSDAIIAIAPELKEHIHSVNPAASVTIIENLAMPELFSRHSGMSPTDIGVSKQVAGKVPILYTGNFEPYQGLDLLVASAEIVCKKNAEAVFMLVGGRPQQIKELAAAVETRGIRDRFIFVGRVPPGQVNQYLEVAHVLVSPRSEGLPVPLKIYSYLYTGKPVLATDISAHHGFHGHENLLLAAPNPEAFAVGLMDAIARSKKPLPDGFDVKRKQIAEEKLKLYLSLIEKSYGPFTVSKSFVAASE